MPGTFSQLYIHVVFAVKGRENLISKAWKDELHKYIAGIIIGKEQKAIIVNGMPDHIHAFIGLRPVMAISDLVRDKKTILQTSSTKNNSLKENSPGRKDMGLFHIHNPILIVFTTIYKIRKNIIEKKRSEKNTFNCFKNFKSFSMRNIYLTG